MGERDWPAVAAWAGALVLLCVTASLAGFNPFSAGTWAHWDSTHYESIARGGYEVHRCTPADIAAGHRQLTSLAVSKLAGAGDKRTSWMGHLARVRTVT